MNSRQTTAGFMAMKGAGYYSKATIGAKHVMDNAAGLVIDAIEAHARQARKTEMERSAKPAVTSGRDA